MDATLAQRLSDLGLSEEEFEERFVRSAGAGGQKVNKVSTCVWLVHRPSGLGVKAMEHRTQGANRAAAWLRLLDLISAEREKEQRAARDERERERRRRRPLSAGAKRRRVESKRHRAQKRAQRSAGGEAGG